MLYDLARAPNRARSDRRVQTARQRLGPGAVARLRLARLRRRARHALLVELHHPVPHVHGRSRVVGDDHNPEQARHYHPTAMTTDGTAAWDPMSISVGRYGNAMRLIESTSIGGDYKIFGTPKLGVRWHLIHSGTLPDCVPNGVGYCHGIEGHPELSTPNQLLISYKDPNSGPGGHMVVSTVKLEIAPPLHRSGDQLAGLFSTGLPRSTIGSSTSWGVRVGAVRRGALICVVGAICAASTVAAHADPRETAPPGVGHDLAHVSMPTRGHRATVCPAPHARHPGGNPRRTASTITAAR